MFHFPKIHFAVLKYSKAIDSKFPTYLHSTSDLLKNDNKI